MKVTFFSNFLNHHQLFLCNAFIEAVGLDNFRFVATTPITNERVSLGYENMNDKYDFVIRAYEGAVQYQFAEALAVDSDIAIFGQSAFSLCEKRLEKNKLSFLYIERQFKKGIISIFHPRVLSRVYKFFKYRKRSLYILCAGAYVKYDLSKVLFPSSKCFKWGYFTDVELNQTTSQKTIEDDKTSFLWCGRFIAWKHPKLAIDLIRKLKRDGYDCTLDMIGVGPLLDECKQYVTRYGLNDCVFFKGSMSNKDVHLNMDTHAFLLFTSDRQEGWGAVLNEAMTHGCVPLASDEIGAVPYLLDDENNCIYKSEDLNSLYDKTIFLLNNKSLVKHISHRIRIKMHKVWNANNAVSNLIALYNGLNAGNTNIIDNGPGAPA